MKIGCVIQGDIRRGTKHVLALLPSKFDFTVLSTWDSDVHKIPSGNYTLVTSAKPKVTGLSNRNCQRLSASRGLQAAKEAGCDYVLKWRTDMLPTKLDLNQLLNWANFNIPKGMKSRLVMPAFRNLSVKPDWFSSIPDLFAFGHIEEMEMLWGDSEFDYSLNMNIPNEMSSELAKDFYFSAPLDVLYSAESELYALLKSRLQIKTGIELNHPLVAINYLRLIDYQRLGIFWFANDKGFRSIGQAWEHAWWTESLWNNEKYKVVPSGYHISEFRALILKSISPIRVKLEQYRQTIAWAKQLRKL
jgi:hypothetical protein